MSKSDNEIQHELGYYVQLDHDRGFGHDREDWPDNEEEVEPEPVLETEDKNDKA